jgi:hypothetical protein
MTIINAGLDLLDDIEGDHQQRLGEHGEHDTLTGSSVAHSQL